MGLFNRNKKHVVPALEVIPAPQSRVEIELHKNASEDAAKKARDVNAHLNDLLVENGFTLKIALAAGAQIHSKKGGSK